MKNETAPPFVHCELTAIINLKSKQDLSLIIHWIDIVGKLSFLNEKVKVLMKKANDERTKWKWKCFTVHCVTLGECLVSETSRAWTNHWSLVGLGRRGYWLCKWEKREYYIMFYIIYQIYMTQLLLLGKFEYSGGPIFKVVLEC